LNAHVTLTFGTNWYIEPSCNWPNNRVMGYHSKNCQQKSNNSV